MKKYYFVVLIFLFFGSHLLSGTELQLVKSIGDEREDYTFFAIGGAILSGKKDIFILDIKGTFLAQYNWSGEFIKRTGQEGRGPKDLSYPRSIDIYRDTLFIHDRGNRRLAEMALDLEKPIYYILDESSRFDWDVYALPNGNFLGVFNTLEENRGRIGIIDQKCNVVRHFFNSFPIDPGADPSRLDKKEDIMSGVRSVIINQETRPVIGIDEDRTLVLISYKKPDNPVAFFVYTIDGHLKKEFSYSLEKKYKFFDLYIKAKSRSDVQSKTNYPAKYFVPGIQSLFIHKNYYIAVLQLHEYARKERVKTDQYLMIFNKEGKPVDNILLPDNLRVFSISPQGYMLTTKWDEEVTKLYIYTLDLK